MGRRTAKRREQHLYLAFDDWDYGYTIRKVRLSPGPGEGSGEVVKLPLPGIFTHIWAPRGLPGYFMSAFATKILVLHAGASDMMGIPIIDVKNRSFYFGPQPNYRACPIYVSIGGDRLFALDIATFEFCFGKPDTAPWVWHKLTYPPFRRHEVLSYAVQPDGCILISTKSDATAAMATYIFDTIRYVWELHGDWALPFTGCGHYTPSLDAFVGLSNDKETLGYLYSCTMVSTSTGDTVNALHPSPDCKCSNETVYSKNRFERHVGATLVHMCRDEFCLVECVAIVNTWADQELGEPGADQELGEAGPDQEFGEAGPDQAFGETGPDQELWELDQKNREELSEELRQLGIDEKELRNLGVDQELREKLRELGIDEELMDPAAAVGDRFMYRLKTFSLRHDANGDLKIEHCRVRCFSVPHKTTISSILQDPVAFWL
ncbi:unnamed protein product [Urochloa decumbens]|uniref:Uncharacterized protein n=1 Tax=Urochloa decumbens TaxID=240449 RepID=A0ABC8XQ40_9POAL